MLPKLNYQNCNRWLFFYTLVTTIVAILLSFRFYQVQSLPESHFGQAFGILHTIGHIGLLAFIAALPLFILNRMINQKTIIIGLAIFISCLGLTLLLADTFIYQQYRFHINAMVIELFIEGGSEIISFPLSMWFSIITIICVIAILKYGLTIGIAKYVQKQASISRLLIWLIPLCLFSANILYIWGDATYNKDITAQRNYLPLALPATAKTFMAKYGLLDIEAHKKQALLKQKKNKGSLQYPIQPIATGNIHQPFNVLWIVIDSWRADTMDKTITPNIYQFAQQSIQFNNHFSGSNNTRHGMFSLFYGLPGTYWETILQNQQAPVLYQQFNQHGYISQVYASAKLTMPEFDQTLFSEIKNLRTHSNGKRPWQRDINATEDFLSNYDTNSPYFKMVFLDAAHGFSLPKNFEKPFTPSLNNINFMALNDDYEVTPFWNLYKNSIYFADQQVGKILAKIQPNLTNTIVLITGDHGKEFNDSKQGYWGHNSNYSNYQTHVPMLIHWPNKKPMVVESMTSHLDIVPTFMSELFKVNNSPKDYSSGLSLFSENTRESIILGRKGYYAVKDQQHLYELDRLGNFSIYNQHYQETEDAQLNMTEVQNALNEMSRFYQQPSDKQTDDFVSPN